MLSYQTHDYVANDFDTRMRAPFEVSHPSDTRYLYNALFQSNSSLIWAAKLMGGGDAAMTLNLAYLLSFFLVFLSAYWACGRLGLRDPFRFCAATLFALMPYHFQRAENHFLESTYYFTPLLALILVQLWSARPLACRWRVDQWRFTWRDKRLWLVLFLLAFLSSFNPYHQFFFACLAASAAPFAALYRKSWRPLFIGWGLAFFACAVLVLKHSLSHHLNAPGLALSVNGMAIGGYGGAEMFPLKLTQLLLPVQGHRWGFLADLRHMYDAANPLNNENSTTTLGFVGGFGVVACVALALVPNTRVRMGRVGKVGLLTLMAILFASMGGLSSLISTISVVIQGPNAMLAQARGWDRIVVFIGFFAYFTAFWLLQRLAKRITPRRFAGSKRPAFIWFVALIAFAFALWDQVPYAIAQQHDGHYRSDIRFFGNLEKQLPPNSRVFQFPFVVHHYSGWVRPGVYYSDQLRPYINTRSLHFTYGGDLGSIQSEWLHAASQLPVNEAAPYLCRYGFAGILIQRNMLEQPATLELQWEAVLDEAPKVSDDADYAFFDLRPFCAAHSIHTLNMEAMKAGLIAQLRNGQHFVPAGALEHKIGHAYLQSDGNVARRADANEAGWLAYGPYGRLRPGRYRAVFRVSSISNYQKKGSLTLDITGKSFGEQHTLNSIAFQPQSTPDMLEKGLDFEVTRYHSDMQYRVFKSEGVGVDFVGVEIRKIPQ
jgi:phosphoglycerol transferase